MNTDDGNECAKSFFFWPLKNICRSCPVSWGLSAFGLEISYCNSAVNHIATLCIRYIEVLLHYYFKLYTLIMDALAHMYLPYSLVYDRVFGVWVGLNCHTQQFIRCNCSTVRIPCMQVLPYLPYLLSFMPLASQFDTMLLHVLYAHIYACLHLVSYSCLKCVDRIKDMVVRYV